jgi:UDP-N-acetyl-D-galactosamine dehydrogenase
MGFTFKENCPDIRNTRVIDRIDPLKAYRIEPIVVDPWVIHEDVMREYNIESLNNVSKGDYDAAFLAVSHKEFSTLNLREIVGQGIIYDVKGFLPKEQIHGRL